MTHDARCVSNAAPIDHASMERKMAGYFTKPFELFDPIRLVRMVNEIMGETSAQESASPSARGGWGLNG